jgi:uncharacterized protein
MLLSEPMIESYYLETPERLLFAVKGFEHPDDRIIAVLRYAPYPEKGDRKKNGEFYRRLYHFPEQEQFLQAAYPQYLHYDPIFQLTLQSVPKFLIRKIYDPRLRLRELMQAPIRNAVEEDAVSFASLLQRETEIPWSGLGITGSLLIGLHTVYSDLDLAIFGAQNCKKVYRALHGMLDTPSNSVLRRLDARGLDDLHAQRAKDTHMDFAEFSEVEKRKVNQGSFRDRAYFIRFIKEACEEVEPYGFSSYRALGRMAITALIADDQEAIFTPCKYLLSDVRNLEALPLPDPTEIVSFRGRFCEQAQAGERIMATGTLERVQSIQGSIRHRLLLGNSPEDTMVLWRG